MNKQELKIITDLYGNICDCSPSDEYMMEHCQRWCEENCGKVEDWQCLQKYIEEKQKESNNSNHYDWNLLAQGLNECLGEPLGKTRSQECPCEFESDLACMNCEETK